MVLRTAVITGSVPPGGLSIPMDAGSYRPRISFAAPGGGTVTASFGPDVQPMTVDVNRYPAHVGFGRTVVAIVAGAVAACALGPAGLGLTIGGGVWLGRRRAVTSTRR